MRGQKIEKVNGTVTVSGNCQITGKPYSVTVPAMGYSAWTRRGVHIQAALPDPDVSADDREFLMSGISPEGWTEMFGPEAEE